MNYREKIGTKENPLSLKTPPQSSSYTMHVDEKDGQQILVCTVGKTILHYDIRCLEALGLAEVTHEKRGNKMRAR